MSHKKSLEEKLEKTENVLRENLNTVRAGRANPALLDRVNVDYYGVPTPLKSLANVSVPDARTLMISPFDPSTLGTIELQSTKRTWVSTHPMTESASALEFLS